MNTIKAILFISFLILLTNCGSENTQELNNSSVKNGIVINACAPTDAAVVRIILTDDTFACDNSLSDVKHISSYLDIENMDEIETGMVLQGYSSDFAIECDKAFNSCSEVGELSIEVLRSNSKSIEGNYILSGSSNKTEFKAIKCETEREICG